MDLCLKEQVGDILVSTVGDSEKRKIMPFETALIINPNKLSEFKVVEVYKNKEDGINGHEKWVNVSKGMTFKDYKNCKDIVVDKLFPKGI